MRIALVDDTAEELEVLTEIINKELPHATLFTFPSGEAFLESWTNNSYDLILLDIYMEEMASVYPVYGFEIHKGYGTKEYTALILEYGVSPVHRRSFLKKLLGENK